MSAGVKSNRPDGIAVMRLPGNHLEQGDGLAMGRRQAGRLTAWYWVSSASDHCPGMYTGQWWVDQNVA